MAGIVENEQKRLIFIRLLLLRIENIKETRKKIEIYIQSIKNI